MQPSTEISRNAYTYGDSNWKDKLTAFNGQTITYDEMGNPLTYRDGLSFTWENGRHLKTVTNNGTTITMRYDSNGMRTQKGGVRYYYDSDNNLIAMVKGNNTLFFYYDENGSATSFSYNGTMYFYVKNLQGDIISIVDSNDTVLVRYDYDVFGKITAIKNGNNQIITDTSSLAFLNPLRYRGYVYDDETGLYYLQSRYYDPVTGRFINADVYTDTESGSPLSTNMFAYCENMLLTSVDYDGTRWEKIRKNVYRPSNIDAFNCYSFALGFPYIQMKPGTRGYSIEVAESKLKGRRYANKNIITLLKEPYSLNGIYEQVIKDLNYLGIGWRYGNKNSRLNNGEYLIAMRIATFYNKTNIETSTRVMYSAYHFMKRDPTTGYWWEKSSIYGFVRCLYNINPDSDRNWIIYQHTPDNPFSKQDYYFRYPDRSRVFLYYNSSTRYLIIKKSFGYDI